MSPDRSNSDPLNAEGELTDLSAFPPASSQRRQQRLPREVVTIERLFARDRAAAGGKARGTIAGLDLVLTDSVHVFLGAPEDGTIALAEVLAGAERPLRGRVLVEGRAPASNAAARARIGVLSATPRLPPASSVDAAVRLAMRSRGETGDRFDAVLDPFGLSPLHGRATRSLSYAEARSVELALALTTPSPRLLVLHEPLIDVTIGELALVRQRIGAVAYGGGSVVITTSSVADARALGDRIHVLQRGRLMRTVSGEGIGLTRTEGELVVWVRAAAIAANGRPGAGVRELAGALARRDEVRAVAWDDPGHGGAGATLRLRGELDACALAVAEEATELGAVVEAMTTIAPGLAEVQAATDAILRARASQPPGAPPAPVLPAAPFSLAPLFPHESDTDA